MGGGGGGEEGGGGGRRGVRRIVRRGEGEEGEGWKGSDNESDRVHVEPYGFPPRFSTRQHRVGGGGGGLEEPPPPSPHSACHSRPARRVFLRSLERVPSLSPPNKPLQKTRRQPRELTKPPRLFLPAGPGCHRTTRGRKRRDDSRSRIGLASPPSPLKNYLLLSRNSINEGVWLGEQQTLYFNS